MSFVVEVRRKVDLYDVGEALAHLRLLVLTFEHVVADIGHAAVLAKRVVLSHVVQVVTQLEWCGHLEAAHARHLVLASQSDEVGARLLARICVVNAHTFAFFQRRVHCLKNKTKQIIENNDVNTFI